jgi:hypothetical protein
VPRGPHGLDAVQRWGQLLRSVRRAGDLGEGRFVEREFGAKSLKRCFQVIVPRPATLLPPDGRLLRGGERVAPPEAREAREVAVGRDEFAPVLDGEGRDVGIRHERTLDLATQAGEHIPVPPAGRDE